MGKVISFFFSLLFSSLLLFISPTSIKAVSINTFQVTTDGSQQKDAFVFKNLIVYDSLSDIWEYNLETKENLPIIQKDGQQYITDLYNNIIIYQDIPPDSSDGDIRVYNITNGIDNLIIGEPNSYSSGGTNGNYVIYLEGGACGTLYAYHLQSNQTEHITDNVCTPKISDDIVYWGEGSPNGSDIRGYDLEHNQYLNIATENGMQGSADMFNGKIVYIDCEGCGFGTYQAVKVKDLRINRVTTVYQTSTNSINWPSISDSYVVWSESPETHVNSIKGYDFRTREVFVIQEPGPHQNSHTMTSIWDNIATWMSWRTGNGDIYASTLESHFSIPRHPRLQKPSFDLPNIPALPSFSHLPTMRPFPTFKSIRN